jgi:hypothetical protein
MLSLSKLGRLAALALLLMTVALPTRAADLDKLAPADAEIAVVINIKNFVNSELFKKYSEEKAKEAFKSGPPSKFLEAAGLDPLKDLESITVTFNNFTGKDESKACIIARGKINVPKVQAAIKDSAKQAGDMLKITVEGGQTFYTLSGPRGGQPSITGTFVGDSALVVSNNLDYLKDIIAGKEIEATPGAKVMKRALGKLSGQETVILAAAVTDEVKEKLGENESLKGTVDKLESATGAVNIGESIDIIAALHATDQNTARNLGQTIKNAIPIIKLFTQGNEEASPFAELLVDNVKVSWEGKSINFRAQFTDEAMTSARDRVQKARLDMGNAALKEMKWREAEGAFTRAAMTDPMNEDAKKGVEKTKATAAGYASLKEKKWSAAEDAFRAALKIDPDLTVAKDGLQKARDKKQ